MTLKINNRPVGKLNLDARPLKNLSIDGRPVYDSGGFPSGYTAVDYLESSGTQWINLNLTFDGTKKITAESEFARLSGVNVNVYVFGVYKRDVSIPWLAYGVDKWGSGLSNHFFVSYGTHRNMVGPVCKSGVFYEHKVILDDGVQEFYVDGVYQAGANVDGYYNSFGRTSALFGHYGNDDKEEAKPTPVRIAKFTISLDDQVVRDMLPCYRNSDNKPGMYDFANRVFYTNAGTGEFIIPTEP